MLVFRNLVLIKGRGKWLRHMLQLPFDFLKGFNNHQHLIQSQDTAAVVTIHTKLNGC